VSSGTPARRGLCGGEVSRRHRASRWRTGARNQDGGWVIGTGWDEGKLAEKRYVTATDLDAVSGDHPVSLVHTTGPLLVANSAALRIAGITRDSPTRPLAPSIAFPTARRAVCSRKAQWTS
jgi:predicted amidohydrolase YtcJ